MGQPKFLIGERVTFVRPTLITPSGDYSVMRVFPADMIEQRYSIKSPNEPYERVVGERDIARIDGQPGAAGPEVAAGLEVGVGA